MLKQILSTFTHEALRRRAHAATETMPTDQVRSLIHRKAPVMGRLFTALASERRQRDRVHQTIDSLTHAGLREAAGDRLPDLAKAVLGWLDK